MKVKKCKQCKKPLDNPRLTYCSYDCANKAKKARAKKKRQVVNPVTGRKVDIKGMKKKLDAMWSKIVRSKGKCEYCGKTEHLNAHHIYSRKNESTRWDTTNGICLCAGHHTFSSVFSAHLTPVEFTEFLMEYKGVEFMDSLRDRKNQINNKSLDEWFHVLNKKLLEIDLTLD